MLYMAFMLGMFMHRAIWPKST